MSFRGFRDSLASIVPRWLSNRPGLQTGYKVLYAIARQADVMTEVGILEAIRSWLPGYPSVAWQTLDVSTALPFIGRSRGILRGEAESDASFATRLRAWIDTWIDAGSSEILVQQIQAYLGNTPTVRIVDRAGFWVSIDPSGTITTATASWNWDGVSNPERINWWSDLWIIVYPSEWPVTGTNLAALVPIWGNRNAGQGFGHGVPRAAVSAVLTLVSTWKGAHTFVQAVIWSYDATLFDPSNPSASGNPDGTWGNWGKLVSGALVPARTGWNNGRVRYWTPPQG